MRTLFLNPPSFEGFDGGASSRWPASREIESYWYPVWLCYPAGMLADSKVCLLYTSWLVIGVIERAGGTLYCTALFFAPDGTLAGKHRKLMPTAMERLIWGFGDGSTLPVIETGFGKIGAVICWENYMPLLRAAMYAKGIQLYCAPTVDDREVWPVTMRHIALEGRCFVLSACQSSVSEKIGGGSVIVGPLGKLLAGPNYEGECILTADIDVGEIAEGKFDLDVAGHYARPDVFRLEVNEGGGWK